MKTAQQNILTSLFRRVVGFYVIVFKIIRFNSDSSEFASGLYVHLFTSLFLKFLFKFIKNPFQHSFGEYLFYQLSRKIQFKPQVVFHDDAPHVLVKANDLPAIILSTHTGFSFATRFISSSKKNTFVVANDIYLKGLMRCFDRSGVTAKVDVILNDKYCLANIKERLSQNATVICCVDYKLAGSESYTLISPNIFKFIHLLNLPVFFHKDEIMPNSHVKINFFKANALLDPNELACSFLDYINESRSHKKVYSLSAKEK